MAELVTGEGGAVVDGVLRLSADGFTPVNGYRVTTTRTPTGIRYDVLTPAGDQLSWTASGAGGSHHQLAFARRTLILGGARSGKSTEAERLMADIPDTLYVATGGDGSTDPEWADRIAKHRARRPASWGLAETIDLVPLLEADGPALLVDCLTLWLARTMDACDIWEHPENVDEVEQRIEDLAAAWSATPRRVIAVSNEVGSGVVPADAGTRLFRDLMGRLNATISRHSDTVLWCVAGRTVAL
ncbi:adenosylcobinamide kinase/adenosylcobinamide phosphate guanyltransferase [Kribbella sp. ALI-6-A]|uniref:bifunctional adenosylcobinamide kinase/adenosylcobinamide-phosphate guanylyltransferase n=1 Tax=Kribbella sp. ALI-6-A TaxID=1933817 RepID=UPI00097C9DAA|nr:bifunctional adenosylcobinamide kinase/adenosylcobinamide-phosphate guanylyltransferase [Kribbella sp. ALI-6-A]ONI69900.1 adenosylcobinamide kinase/adenosylcobinamide phosphate guanyltransferase [Kribbella sp. ALI-6-A]